MVWKNGADLSLGALKAMREELQERAAQTERCIGWLTSGSPAAARLHELELDEINGQLDALSDEIGRLEHEAYEERAGENLLSIGRRYNLSEY